MVSKFEKDVLVLCESSDIEVDRALSDFYKMSAFYALEAENSTGEASSQASQKSKSKFRQVIERIWNAIVNALKNFGNAISSLFKGNVSPEEYFKNPNVKIKLDEDVKGINEQIDAELRKGRKLINLISKKTKVSDKVVEDYVDGAAEKINSNFKKVGAVVLTGAAGLATFLGIKAFANRCKEECDGAKKDCDNAKTDDPTDQKNMLKIFSTMNNLKSVGVKKSSKFVAACKNAMTSDKADNTANNIDRFGDEVEQARQNAMKSVEMYGDFTNKNGAKKKPTKQAPNNNKHVNESKRDDSKSPDDFVKNVKKTVKTVKSVKKNWNKAVNKVLG